ncbi:AraC family transcriptional regulator [Aureimonas fodinaquatilis]|nr:AraC family transcriptional regulator [Aureimonas fodinaquatilis]
MTRFATCGMPAADQFQAWSDFLQPVVNLGLTERSPGGFDAEFTAWDLGSMVFCDIATPCEAPSRNWQHAANPSGDHWYLILHNSGPSTNVKGRQETRSLNFRSLARRSAGVTDSTNTVALLIPRDLYTATSALLDSVCETIPDVGPGAMLADYLLMVRRHLNELDQIDVPALAAATKAMVSFCLAPSMDRAAIAQGAISITCFERARQIIRRDLLLPELDADHLCRAMGISRSRLYRLFDAVGGVSNYIRRQRLLAARDALSDLADLRPIGVIAFSVGFADASGFSRAYHREFGCSPSDTRMERLAGRAIALPVRPLPRTDGSSQFEDLLRQLRA